MKYLLILFVVLIFPFSALAHVYVCEVAEGEVVYLSFQDQNHFSLLDSGPNVARGEYVYQSSSVIPKYGAVDLYAGAKPSFYLKAGMNDMIQPLTVGFIVNAKNLQSYYCSLSR